jgi:hypothetical protein
MQPAAAAATADSIMQSLKSGLPFDSIAKKYNQRGEKTWISSKSYEGANMMAADDKEVYRALLNQPVGEVKNLTLTQGNMIVEVTGRKGSVEKYDVAIVKRVIDFSNETYNEAYNKFSQFVSESQDIEGLQAKCAEFGYMVLDTKVANTSHTIANIRSSHDALRWLFTDAEEGHISKVYDRCGDNDRLLVVGLSKINPKGYASQESVSETLKQEVIRDKKFAKLAEQLAGVKSIAEAQAKGARVDSVSHITFRAPTYVPSIAMPEVALSGAVAGADKGAFSKGTFDLTTVQKLGGPFDVMLKLSGQIAGCNLDSSEHIYLGGARGVRAYPQGEASGDEGLLGTLELRYHTPVKGLVLSTYFDAGHVRIEKDDHGSMTLKGWGIGLSYTKPNDWFARFDYARRIGSDDKMTEDARSRQRMWFIAGKVF